MVMTQEYVLPVARDSSLFQAFTDLFIREKVVDVVSWLQAHDVKWVPAIKYHYFTFADYDAWVQFRLAWL
jgi:hypothetical protein